MSFDPNVFQVAVGAVRNMAFDMRGILDGSETITGTPTAVVLPAGELVTASVQTNAAIVEVNGKQVPIGQAVLFKISGQVAGNSYTITIDGMTTDSTPAQTLDAQAITVEGVAAGAS